MKNFSKFSHWWVVCIFASCIAPLGAATLPAPDFRLAFYDNGSAEGVFFRNYPASSPAESGWILPGMLVIPDNDGRFYYGTEGQSVFKVDSETGTAVEMQLGTAVPELSWPMGVTFDTRRQRVVLVSLGGEGYLYAYSPAQGQWSLISSMNNLDLDGVVYHAADDTLYGVEVHGPSIHQLNPMTGAVIGQIPLPSVPDISPTGNRAELISAGDYLVLLVEPPHWWGNTDGESIIYVIDPRTGESRLTYRKVPNRAPTAALIAPAEGATFAAGSTILLEAAASDPDGTVQSVQFFANGQSAGFGTRAEGTSSFRLEWRNAGSGEQILTAAATDNGGAKTVSASRRIIVEGSPDARLLLNVNFGAGATKTGRAATGVSANDHWNHYVHPWIASTNLDDLRWADGSASAIDLSVENAGGQWYNFTRDAMYDSYIYPNNGQGDGVGNVVVRLTSLPGGTYDVYLYGKADPTGHTGPSVRAESDTIFTLYTRERPYDPRGTWESAGWKIEEGWREGYEYVRFQNVLVQPGQGMTITAAPGFNRQPASGPEHPAVINGLQLLQTDVIPTNPVPVVTVHATDAVGSEEGPDPVVFTIRRSPVSNTPLRVYHHRSSLDNPNTAIFGSTEIPGGAESADVVLTPIDDSIVQGDRPVSIQLTHPVFGTTGPVPPLYQIGQPGVARATIQDNDARPPSGTLIAVGSTWKYLDDGTDQGGAWRGREFNDSGWALGAAQLGYGDGDETTIVSFGPNAGSKYVTTYFRRAFELADSSGFSNLSGRLLADDGAVVYLNGVEVFRSNMPAGEIAYNTLATSVAESDWVDFSLDPVHLIDGRNVVAVEVHQVNVASSDISFDFELRAQGGSMRAPGRRVVGWGDNNWHQLNIPADLTNAIAIAAGQYHSMALRANGTVALWGGNGADYEDARMVPPGLDNVAAISANFGTSMALRGDGTVVPWGVGISEGYFGDDEPLELTGITAIAAGGFHALALRSNGTVAAWGFNHSGQTDVPEGLADVVAIAGGPHSSLALKADGTVAGWGHYQATPPFWLSNVVAIAAGWAGNFALRADGTLVGWGTSPSVTHGPPSDLTDVVAVTLGEGHAVALRQNGTVVAWGDIRYAQPPTAYSNVVAVASTYHHTLALLGDGSPEITVQPWNRIVRGGVAVSFTVKAVGASPLTFQWQLNGSNLPNETNDTLRIASASNRNAGAYRAIVRNARGSATSRVASLRVESEDRPTYSIINLGTLGGDVSEAFGLNDLGHVVGGSRTRSGEYRAFLYTNGQMTEIAVPAPYGSEATRINNRGDVIGTYDLDAIGDKEVPFIYRNGRVDALPTVTGNSSFLAANLNESGDLAGTILGTRFFAAVFRGGQLINLGGLPESRSDSAAAINEQGVVVGASSVPRENLGINPRAAIYSNGVVYSLGTLPGGDFSWANDINERNEVVGASAISNAHPRAFLYRGGTLVNLGTLAGHTRSWADGINNEGVIIGHSDQGGAESRAFVYRRGQMWDLTSLLPTGSGWVLQRAHDISERGQVVGVGLHNGVTRAFLVSPVDVVSPTNLPVVSVSPRASTASETQQFYTTHETGDAIVGPGPWLPYPANGSYLTVGRQGSTNTALSVHYSLSGTASNGIDYIRLGGIITIPAGARSASVHVLPIEDRFVEGDETVVLTLRSNASYRVASSNTAVVTIRDNDPDADGDGVSDYLDACGNTPVGTIVDANGCPRANTVCAPDIEWQAGLGDERYQRFHRVKNHRDGGYVAGGQDFGRAQMWLVRLHSDGSKVWERFHNGSLNDLQSTADGGYIIAGTISSSSGNAVDHQAQLLRLNSNGDVLWNRTYGGAALDTFQSVRQTADGGFIAAGDSWSTAGGDKTDGHFGQSDAWIVRFDAQGNKVWDRTYGGGGHDNGGSAFQTSDGGYLLQVSSESPASGNKTLPGFGEYDSWVLKLDSTGAKVWERIFGTSTHDGGGIIDVRPDGSFLLSGFAGSIADGSVTAPGFGGSDAWVLLLDPQGNPIWERSFGGSGPDALYCGQRMTDGGFILAGYSQSPPSGNKTSRQLGGQDMWLVRIDAQGRKLWDRTIGGSNPNGSSANDVAITPDGGLIVAGETFNDIGGDKTVPWLGTGDGWVIKLRRESADCEDRDDTDGDGVPNSRDQCPNTPSGVVVNARGCSLAQLCPCDGNWENHGEYVRCVIQHAWEFYRAGLIDGETRTNIVAIAARSGCGRQAGSPESMFIHFCPQTREECQREGVRVVIAGEAVGRCMIEVSSDLIHWSPLTGEAIIGDEIALPISSAVQGRFYRARVTP